MTLRFLSIAQSSLVVALGCTATYSFCRSFAYPYVEDAASDITGHLEMRVLLALATVGIGALSVLKKSWLAGAIWLVVLLCLARVAPLWLSLGAVTILLGIVLVYRRGQVWGFLAILAALYFPSLMAFSSVEWLWFMPDFAWETDLTFVPMMALGGWLIVGYLALHYVTELKESGTDLISRGHEIGEVRKWYINKLAFVLVVLLSAALTMGFVIWASIGLERLVGGQAAGISFRAILFGIGGSALLIVAIYYVLIGRKPA